MASDEEARARLGRAVKLRRTEIGLSLRRAALSSGIARNTWKGLEEGTRATQDQHYGAIERTLLWPAGEMLRIWEGHPGEGPSDDEIRRMDYMGLARYATDLKEREGAATSNAWLARAISLRTVDDQDKQSPEAPGK